MQINDQIKNDCSILISSHDSYSDVWGPFFTLFFKYWPDCPFPLYLISETKTYIHEKVNPILLKEDKKWAANMGQALEQIKTSYLIYLQEDYLFTKKVDTHRILRLVDVLKNNHAGYIRLYPSPPPKIAWNIDPSLGVISKRDDYSVSLQAAVWDKDVFNALLVNGETGWDMEMKGSKRAQNTPQIFLSVLKNQPAIDYYCTAIKKGVWFRDAVTLVRREGINFTSMREIETISNYLLRISGLRKYINKFKRINQRKFKPFGKRIFNAVEFRLLRLRDIPFERRLFMHMQEQKRTFIQMNESFSQSISNLIRGDMQGFVDSHWEILNQKFLEVMKNDLPFNFLRNPIISYTMFIKKGGHTMKTELAFLKSVFSDTILKKTLREDYVGMPLVMEHSYSTSHNTIHLLYHLARFQQVTNVSISTIKTVVEWGGGYGRMAILFSRLRDPEQFTYVIIDTPIFSAIQWRYISTILGKERVNFLNKIGSKIIHGKINIVPLNFINDCDIKADLFLSTWALSESTPFALKYVIQKNMYFAKNILIGFQDKSAILPDSEGVKTITNMFGGTVEDIAFLPKNHYIFK